MIKNNDRVLKTRVHATVASDVGGCLLLRGLDVWFPRLENSQQQWRESA